MLRTLYALQIYGSQLETAIIIGEEHTKNLIDLKLPYYLRFQAKK